MAERQAGAGLAVAGAYAAPTVPETARLRPESLHPAFFCGAVEDPPVQHFPPSFGSFPLISQPANEIMHSWF